MEQIRTRIRLTFIDELLGTAAADPDVHTNYIASKAPDVKSLEEEVATVGVQEVVDSKMTIFSRLPDGTPVLWSYQIRGFFKSACSALRRLNGTRSSKLKAYKKAIDLTIFVYPDATDPASRAIPITLPEGGQVGDCQRPLRASTPQGERVALANSETMPKGSMIEFDVVTYTEDDMETVREWLDYGQFNGLGQWRNSGKGAFVWEELDKDGKVIGGNKAA